MRFNSIGYMISEGFKSFFKQKKMTSASIVIMCATMFMFGIFFLIGENVNFAMSQLESEQGIRVMIKEGATDSEIEKLRTEIQSIDGVSTVTFISKSEALATVKSWIANSNDSTDLLEGYDEDNPFPASYFVTLTDLSKNNEVQKKIKELDNVDDLSTDNDVISKLATLARTIQIITLVLLIMLIAISIFIIAYTIKITVYARRREISIMKYVGATNGFIRGPFIVEGIIIGVISALITLIIIGIAYDAVLAKIMSSAVMQSISISLYTFKALFARVLIVYLLLGIGIGTLGSIISMNKYLKV